MGGQNEDLQEKERKAKGLPVRRDKKKSDRRVVKILLGFVIATFLHSTMVVLGSAWLLLYMGLPFIFCLSIGLVVSFLIPESILKLSNRPVLYWSIFSLAFVVATIVPVLGAKSLLHLQSQRFDVPEGSTVESRSVRTIYMDDDPGFRLMCSTGDDSDTIRSFFIADLQSKGWQLTYDSRENLRIRDDDRWRLRFKDGRRILRVEGEEIDTFSVYYRPWRLN